MHSYGYDTTSTKGESVERVIRSGPMVGDGKGIGSIRARPGSNPLMSRSGAIDGKNPDAQVSKPQSTHTIHMATN